MGWLRRSVALPLISVFFLFLSSQGVALQTFSPAAGCSARLAYPIRDLASIRELRIGSYNLLNFFRPGVRFEKIARDGQVPVIKRIGPKSAQHQREEARAIRESGFDIVVVQEMEQIETLESVAHTYLRDESRAVMIRGNDRRALDVGFLVKRDLPLEFELRTHRDERWPGHDVPLFSRDLPVLLARVSGQSRPIFALLGTHYKSKRDSLGDLESVQWRTVQVERTTEILSELEQEFGRQLPLILAGDFNGNLHRESAFESLRRTAMADAFDLVKKPLTDRARATHIYFPDDHQVDPDQLDAILVSENLHSAVRHAFVYHYRFPDGTFKPMPRNMRERRKNPSDHFPIGVVLDFQWILKLAEISQ
jgi:hypothetical protein